MILEVTDRKVHKNLREQLRLTNLQVQGNYETIFSLSFSLDIYICATILRVCLVHCTVLVFNRLYRIRIY